MATFKGQSDKGFAEAVKDAIKNAKSSDAGSYEAVMYVDLVWKENPGGVGQYKVELKPAPGRP